MDADKPFRLRVLIALTDTLKTITPGNGYQHDLSDKTVKGKVLASVFRGRTKYGEGDPLPMVSVLEHPSALDPSLTTSNEGQAGTDGERDWVLLIQGFVKDDKENPTDPAHMLVADVIKAIASQATRRSATGRPNILGLGFREPMVQSLRIGSPVVRPGDGEVSDQAFFWLTITLTLIEDLEKPFAVPDFTL